MTQDKDPQETAHAGDPTPEASRGTPQQGDAPGDDNAGDAKPKPRLSGRAKLILIVLALLALVALAVWFIRYESTGKFLQETNDATIQADAVTVSPRISGYVAQVLVADNQDVQAGQPLVRLDTRDYRAKAEQADAQIAQGEASADSARASKSEQFAAIAQSRAQLAAARAKAAYDAAEVERYIPLAASGAETRQQLAQLRIAAAQSAQDARAQAAGLLMQQRHVATFDAQIRQANAQTQGARAQRDSATVDVNATLLRAPIAGRVGDKSVVIGQYAQTGTRLMSIVPLDRLYIVANFKETQLSLMRVGQPATITVDALSGVDLRGRVESVSPGTGAQFSLIPPQNATGNFTKIVQRVPVRVSVEATPEARRLLLPGLSVNVTVDTIGAKGDLDKVQERQKQLKGQGR